jgi:heme exporter protein C
MTEHSGPATTTLPPRGRPLAILLALAAAGMLIAIWAVFRFVPTALAANGEPNPVQRIFYFHVPSAIMAFLAVGVWCAGSIGWLVTRRTSWDRIGAAATEVGLTFCTIVLVTGPIWAKPEWGRAWTWEPRLNLTAVLWLVFLGGVLVRRYSAHRDEAARFTSILGILGVPVVYLVYTAVERWGGLHPTPTIGREAPSHDPRIDLGFKICLVAFLLLFTFLVALRSRLGLLTERIENLRAAAEDLHAGAGRPS